MSKAFGELVRETLDTIQRQRHEDRDIFRRLFEAVNQYEGRHRDSHEIERLSETSAELSIKGERITSFSVKDGMVTIGQDTMSEADALPKLAEKTARTVAVLDDRRTHRQQ